MSLCSKPPIYTLSYSILYLSFKLYIHPLLLGDHFWGDIGDLSIHHMAIPVVEHCGHSIVPGCMHSDFLLMSCFGKLFLFFWTMPHHAMSIFWNTLAVWVSGCYARFLYYVSSALALALGKQQSRRFIQLRFLFRNKQSLFSCYLQIRHNNDITDEEW